MPIEELIPQEIDDIPATIQATLTEPARRTSSCPGDPDRQGASNLYHRKGTSLYTSMAATYTAACWLEKEILSSWRSRPASSVTSCQPLAPGCSSGSRFRGIPRRDCGLRTIARKMHPVASRTCRFLDLKTGRSSACQCWRSEPRPVMTKTYASTLTALHLLLLNILCRSGLLR